MVSLFRKRKDEEKNDVVIESSGSTHEQKSGVTYRSHLDDSGTVIKREVYDRPAPSTKSTEPVIDEAKSTATAKGFSKIRDQLDNVSEKLGKPFRRRGMTPEERAEELAKLEYEARKAELKSRKARARGDRIAAGVRNFTGGQRAPARKPVSIDPFEFKGLSTEAFFFGSDGAGGGSGMAEFNASAYANLFKSGFSGNKPTPMGLRGDDFARQMLGGSGGKEHLLKEAMSGPGGFSMSAYNEIMNAGFGAGGGGRKKKGKSTNMTMQDVKSFYGI